MLCSKEWFSFWPNSHTIFLIFARIIAIKKYCNKKFFFSSCELKTLFFCQWRVSLENHKNFEMSLQYFEAKIIFLSQYLFISILCVKILCVNKAFVVEKKLREYVSQIHPEPFPTSFFT